MSQRAPHDPDRGTNLSRRSPVVIGLSDTLFYVVMGILGGAYVLVILLLLAGNTAYMVESATKRADAVEAVATQPAATGSTVAIKSPEHLNPILAALADEDIQHSIILSLVTCTVSAILSLWVAVPAGYLLSRVRFPGRNIVDAILDIPIVLPPLVVGLSLLILFRYWPLTAKVGGTSINRMVVYQVPAVIIAQFMVAAAFAVRTMKATFDHINPRCEQVALSLGCSRVQAFGRVVLPEAKRGMLTAFTLAWARALGEFGPLLIFAGATRKKTEVLSTTVFLELSIGDLEAAVAVSLIMVAAAVAVLIAARLWGTRDVSL